MMDHIGTLALYLAMAVRVEDGSMPTPESSLACQVIILAATPLVLWRITMYALEQLPIPEPVSSARQKAEMARIWAV